MPQIINNTIPNPSPFYIDNNYLTESDQGDQGLPPQAIVSIVQTINLTETTDALYQDLQTNPTGISVFTDYMVNNRYARDDHIYMLPTTSPSGVSARPAFVQLAQTTVLWLADWTAAKLNEQPEIPNPTLTTGLTHSPTANEQNWVTMDQHLEPANIGIGPDGVTPLYRISGTYVYGCVAPSTLLVNDISFGRNPWIPQGSVSQSMPSSKLYPEIIVS